MAIPPLSCARYVDIEGKLKVDVPHIVRVVSIEQRHLDFVKLVALVP